jgi:hypothetical protein
MPYSVSPAHNRELFLATSTPLHLLQRNPVSTLSTPGNLCSQTSRHTLSQLLSLGIYLPGKTYISCGIADTKKDRRSAQAKPSTIVRNTSDYSLQHLAYLPPHLKDVPRPLSSHGVQSLTGDLPQRMPRRPRLFLPGPLPRPSTWSHPSLSSPSLYRHPQRRGHPASPD